MARGLESFAAGLVSGFTQGKKNQREQEMHDLQVAEMKDRRALSEELKKLDTEVSPTEGFVVMTSDGTQTVFESEDAAKEAVQGTPDARMMKGFIVGGQTFGSKEAAEEAAATANSPAYKMRQRMELAMKYNQPQLAGQYGQAYKQMVDTNRQMVFDQYNQYRTAGNVEGIMNMLNSRPGARGQSQIVETDGGYALQTTVNGQPYVGQAFSSLDELLDGVGAQISATPDNFFERNMAMKRFGLDKDKFAHQKDVDGKQLSISAGQLGVAQGNLNLRQQEFEESKNRGWDHRPVSGVDAQGNIVVTPTYWTKGPDGKSQLNVGNPNTLTGVSPASARDPLLFGAGGGVGAQPGLGQGMTPEQIRALGDALVNANNARARPGPGAAGAPTTQGQPPPTPGSVGLRIPSAFHSDPQEQLNPYGGLPYGR